MKESRAILTTTMAISREPVQDSQIMATFTHIYEPMEWPVLHLTLLHPRFCTSRRPEKRLHPTSYLDGICGIAAFIVFLSHIHKHLSFASWLDNHASFVSLVFQGQSAVAVFFVVSGFSISYKPLSLARAHKFSALGENLMPAVCRRHGQDIPAHCRRDIPGSTLRVLGSAGSPG